MTYQAPLVESPLDEVCVAVDLETTGVNPDQDEIIEVGAVKFQGERVLGTFHSLVNPGQPIPPFIRSLTGITQREVDRAPFFTSLAPALEAFLGSCTIVGQNISFDLAFLRNKQVAQANPAYDTWEMASVLLPRGPDYSLGRLAANLGVTHVRPHRALEDAQVAHRVFLALMERALALPPAVAGELARIASRAGWRLAPLWRRVESLALSRANALPSALALDVEALGQRFSHLRPLSATTDLRPVDEELLARVLSPEGPLARRFPGYEPRREQQVMALEVARAINSEEHLVVEGGTGVGKSLAYLLPAVLFAAANGRRVVVSTATINLQEQLVHKDLPALLYALEGGQGVPASRVQVAHLKGRANYLCLRRWLHLRGSDTLSPEEARLLAKTLVWLQDTATGDRAELTLPFRELPLWGRLSAQGAAECVTAGGVCFLRHAREGAEGAHILVVNHSLLLSDLARGGGALPPYDHLIVDEAHHLEEEATRQFGFQVTQSEVEALLDAIAGPGGVTDQVRSALGRSSLAERRRQGLQTLLESLIGDVARCRQMWGRLLDALYQFLLHHYDPAEERQAQFRVTRAVRAQPGWSELEVAWENADLTLKAVLAGLQEVGRALESAEEEQVPPRDVLLMEAVAQGQAGEELRGRAREFVVQPQSEVVYWLTGTEPEGVVELHAAPLDVGPLLEKRLFSQKRMVVLTGATLSANGTFDYFRGRVGLSGGRERLVGSPFDYRRAVLLGIPQDMPEPTSARYMESLQQALVDLATAAQGRTMVLFTSHAALRGTHAAIKGALESAGIGVLGQGVDGQPRHLLHSFQDDPRMVLLGTASFWEGVDIRGGPLKVLVLARLPFHVPTEPVFAARSQLFEDPFHQYAVPQAVLRFRQGFGRLIRSRDDQGVVVVLDRRITSKSYGRQFLDAIPACTVSQLPLRELLHQVRRWLQGT